MRASASSSFCVGFGTGRPTSHPSTVRRDTPATSANWSRVRFRRSRMARTENVSGLSLGMTWKVGEPITKGNANCVMQSLTTYANCVCLIPSKGIPPPQPLNQPDKMKTYSCSSESSTARKFCGQFVDLDAEGVTYKNGSCAHESCEDSDSFEKSNTSDFRD